MKAVGRAGGRTGGRGNGGCLAWALALNLVYLALAGGFFVWILNYTRQRGLLTKFSTQ